MFVFEIRDRLVAMGVGTFGTNIFIGAKASIPSGSGPYLSILETGGSGAARTQNDTATERPTAQILVRGMTEPLAKNMIKAAYDALGGANGLFNVTLTGTFYLSITARQNLTDIGLDDPGRQMYDFNIDAEKAPS